MKVALFLEEAGLPNTRRFPVDGRTGDQHNPEYKAINPNAKAPTLVDDVTRCRVRLERYPAVPRPQKPGQFTGLAPPSAGDMLSWLMFVATGVGPYSGQSVHFRHHAPERLEYPYAVPRYMFEARRHLRHPRTTRLADQQVLARR